MKISPAVSPSSTSTQPQKQPSSVVERQPLIQRQTSRQRDANGPRAEQQSDHAPRADNRVKRALQEPQQGINESFQDFQKRHFQWRKGFGKIPHDEGKQPPKPLWEKGLEVVLTAATAPGIGPGEMVTPEVVPAEVEVPPTTGAPSAARPTPSTAEASPEPTAQAGLDAAVPPVEPGTPEVSEVDWGEYMREDGGLLEKKSAEAIDRQEKLYKNAGIDVSGDSDSDSVSSSSNDVMGPEYELVTLYTQDSNENFNNMFRYDGEAGAVMDKGLTGELADVVEGLPKTEGVTLYRGGSGGRGTSGEMFRSGEIKVGDALVNTDFTSFTENPYQVKDFFGDNAARRPGGYTYDETSVVFILEEPKDAHAIAPLSATPSEAESMYTPGHNFIVKSIKTSTFNGRPLVQVQIAEADGGTSSGKTFDLRTGKPFDRNVMVDRIGPDYADRFFPAH